MHAPLRSSRIPTALRLPVLLALLAAALVIGACDDGEPGADGSAEATAGSGEEVVREWSETLRSGDERGAAELFALPSTVQNGVAIQRLENRGDALAFNRSLPCGAKLIGARQEGEVTIATFRLTERPGAGECGSGTGARARTAFVVREGLIVQWRRLPVGGRPPAPGEVPENPV